MFQKAILFLLFVLFDPVAYKIDVSSYSDIHYIGRGKKK